MNDLPEGKEYYGFGKTVDDAVEDALTIAKVPRDKVTVEVLDEGVRGILGLLGGRMARVKVIVPLELVPKETVVPEPVALREVPKRHPARTAALEGPRPSASTRAPLTPLEEIPDLEERIDRAKTFVAGLFQHLSLPGVEISVSTREGIVLLDLKGEHLGLIIGRRGETLDALQYLTNLVANKGSHQMVKLILDAEGYRRRREDSLRQLGERLSRKVKTTGRRAVLEPMTPQERRIIHLALQDDPDIYTYSEGEEPYRRVVIDLKKKQRRQAGAQQQDV